MSMTADISALALTLALSLSASACAATAGADFAIVKLDGSGEALLVAASPIAPGATVALEYPGADQRPRCCHRLRAAELVAVDSAEVFASDELFATAPRVYKAKVPSAWADMPFIGMAAVGSDIRPQSRAGRFELTDSRGATRAASLCTSAEGVHLMETEQGRLRTHLYLSLGYEIESPTCR